MRGRAPVHLVVILNALHGAPRVRETRSAQLIDDGLPVQRRVTSAGRLPG